MNSGLRGGGYCRAGLSDGRHRRNPAIRLVMIVPHTMPGKTQHQHAYASTPMWKPPVELTWCCPRPPPKPHQNETTPSPRGAARGRIALNSGVVCGVRTEQTTLSRVEMLPLLSPAKHDDVYLILRHVNAMDACDPGRSFAGVALHLHHLRAAQSKQTSQPRGGAKDKNSNRETTNGRILRTCC